MQFISRLFNQLGFKGKGLLLATPDQVSKFQLFDSFEVEHDLNKKEYFNICNLGLSKSTSYYAVLAEKQLGNLRLYKTGSEANTFIDDRLGIYTHSEFLFTDPGHWRSSPKLHLNKASMGKPESFFLEGARFNKHLQYLEPINLNNQIYLHHPSMGNYGHDLLQLIPWIIHIINTGGDLLLRTAILPQKTLETLSWLVGEVPGNKLLQNNVNPSAHQPVSNMIFAETLSHATGYLFLRNLFAGQNILQWAKDCGIAQIKNAWKSKTIYNCTFLTRGEKHTRISNYKELLSAMPSSTNIVDVMKEDIAKVSLKVALSDIVIAEPGASLCSSVFVRPDGYFIGLWPTSTFSFKDKPWEATWPTVAHLFFANCLFVPSVSMASTFSCKQEYSPIAILQAIRYSEKYSLKSLPSLKRIIH